MNISQRTTLFRPVSEQPLKSSAVEIFGANVEKSLTLCKPEDLDHSNYKLNCITLFNLAYI